MKDVYDPTVERAKKTKPVRVSDAQIIAETAKETAKNTPKTTPKPTEKTTPKTEEKTVKTPLKTPLQDVAKRVKIAIIIPDDQLLDLTEENFVLILQKLGGKQISTAQMLPYFKITKNTNPQQRWPKLRLMGNKMAKATPAKVTAVKVKSEWRFTLV